jgi:BTB/POZ domain-containing protein KCTD9
MADKISRVSYPESCRRLQAAGLLDDGELPRMPDRVPRYDDETVGVSFFRTWVNEVDFSNLTLPRIYVGRSKIERVSFHNADLIESNLCWNDFLEVDFSAAVLARSDLRRSVFYRVNFTDADLCGTDFRGSSFKGCVFDRAIMNGAILAGKQSAQMSLDQAQKTSIEWRKAEGPNPDGG